MITKMKNLRTSLACCVFAGLLAVQMDARLEAREISGGVVRYAQVTEAVKDAGKSAVDTATTAKEAVEKSGEDAARKIEDLWRRVDESRLKNRTPDEIVAWVIMGIVVGATAGMLTSLNTTPIGRLGRLMLGLAGAFIGGIVAHVGHFDFGLGPVMIRYEELLFSFVGAIVLVVVMRLIRSKSTK